MADGDRRFLYFSVRDPGSQSDGNAYETSSLCREVNKGNLGDYYLLADAGYSGSAEVIVPFSGAGLGDRKNQFNFRQVSPYYYLLFIVTHAAAGEAEEAGHWMLYATPPTED